MAEIKRQPGPGSKQLDVLVRGLGKTEARVGWFETAKYEDGTPVALAAIVNEFGSPQNAIPPRSFFRTTIMDQGKNWSKIVAAGAKASLQGGVNVGDVIEMLAARAAGDVRKKITKIWTPALKPETIKNRIRRTAGYQNLKTRKGRAAYANRKLEKAPKSLTKPLVDTGFLLDSLTYDVSKKP